MKSISLQKYFFSLKNSYQITKNAQQKALPPERETGLVFFFRCGLYFNAELEAACGIVTRQHHQLHILRTVG